MEERARQECIVTNFEFKLTLFFEALNESLLECSQLNNFD